jgi:CheY-like chemotaxis protein
MPFCIEPTIAGLGVSFFVAWALAFGLARFRPYSGVPATQHPTPFAGRELNLIRCLLPFSMIEVASESADVQAARILTRGKNRNRAGAGVASSTPSHYFRCALATDGFKDSRFRVGIPQVFHSMAESYLDCRTLLPYDCDLQMSRISVLIVEDFEPFCKFVSSVLTGAGLEVVGLARDGAKAVEMAQELRPDLILLDVGLPKLGGIEVAKRIRSADQRSRILFLSQEFSADVVQEALRSGGLGYVHKSRAQSELLPAIESVLAGKQFVSGGLENETREVRTA